MVVGEDVAVLRNEEAGSAPFHRLLLLLPRVELLEEIFHPRRDLLPVRRLHRARLPLHLNGDDRRGHMLGDRDERVARVGDLLHRGLRRLRTTARLLRITERGEVESGGHNQPTNESGEGDSADRQPRSDT